MNKPSGTGQEYRFSFGQLVFTAVHDQMLGLGVHNAEYDFFPDEEHLITWGSKTKNLNDHEKIILFCETHNYFVTLAVSQKYVGKWGSAQGRKKAVLSSYVAIRHEPPGVRLSREELWASRGIEASGKSFHVFAKGIVDVFELYNQAMSSLTS